MMYHYNIVQLFHQLPLDIKRLIFEFDDTYRYSFSTDIFKEQLLYRFFTRSYIEETVTNLIYSYLEFLIKIKSSWESHTGVFVIYNGFMMTKRTWNSVKEPRKEIGIIFFYKNKCLRWKLILSGSNRALYNDSHGYDGCIGNKVNNPNTYIRYVKTEHICPDYYQHIGDSFWF
jgi:hypothetical protein